MAWTERYVRSDAAGGGDGTTNTNSGANGAWTLAEGITNEAAGQRINVRAGTYASTTTNRTFAATGTTTAPIWWRGFNTAIGDIDADQTLTKPALTFTTGQFSVTGTHIIFSNLNISGACTTAGGQVVVSGNNNWLDRCRVTNTAANAAARAFTSSGVGVAFTRGYLTANASAGAVVSITTDWVIRDSTITGGSVGVSNTTGTAGAGILVGNTIFSTGSHGYELTAAASRQTFIDRNSFYSTGGDGIRFTGLPSMGTVSNCIFSNCAGYGINNASGANTNFIHRSNNDFYSNTSGTENGFGDSPSLSEQAEVASPFVNAAGGDFTLAAAAVARGKGAPYPGAFENQSYTGSLSVGAVQPSASGGGGLFTNSFGGGML